jgi:hypothetical protein
MNFMALSLRVAFVLSVRYVAYATGIEQGAAEYFAEILQDTMHVTSSQDSLDTGIVVE